MPFTYGAIRMLQAHVMHERHTLIVVAGTPNPADGEISLAEAQDLVRLGQVRWIGTEPPEEVARPPFSSGETSASPWSPPEVTSELIA
jgi:hypothetical protein